MRDAQAGDDGGHQVDRNQVEGVHEDDPDEDRQRQRGDVADVAVDDGAGLFVDVFDQELDGPHEAVGHAAVDAAGDHPHQAAGQDTHQDGPEDGVVVDDGEIDDGLLRMARRVGVREVVNDVFSRIRGAVGAFCRHLGVGVSVSGTRPGVALDTLLGMDSIVAASGKDHQPRGMQGGDDTQQQCFPMCRRQPSDDSHQAKQCQGKLEELPQQEGRNECLRRLSSRPCKQTGKQHVGNRAGQPAEQDVPGTRSAPVQTAERSDHDHQHDLQADGFQHSTQPLRRSGNASSASPGAPAH